jgi:hypothetical protein
VAGGGGRKRGEEGEEAENRGRDEVENQRRREERGRYNPTRKRRGWRERGKEN